LKKGKILASKEFFNDPKDCIAKMNDPKRYGFIVANYVLRPGMAFNEFEFTTATLPTGKKVLTNLRPQ